MRFANYEDAYAALGIEQGREADLFDVKRAWRYLVKYHHPDIFTNHRLREEATERLKRYNAAYEHLKKYWETYKRMPPRTQREDYGDRQSHDANTAGTHYGGGDSPWQTSASGATTATGRSSSSATTDKPEPNDTTEETFGRKRSKRAGTADGATGWRTGTDNEREAFWRAYNSGATAGEKSAEERFWEEMDAQHPPPKTDRQASFGPPPFKRTFVYDLLEKFERLENDPDTTWLAAGVYIASFALVLVIATSAFKGIYRMFGFDPFVGIDTMPGSTLFVVLLCTTLYFVYFGWHYYYKTYKLLLHPFVQLDYAGTPDAVLQKLNQGLQACQRTHNSWQIGSLDIDEYGFRTITAVMSCKTVFNTIDDLKITIKVWERSPNVSAVAFWFEESGGPFKRNSAVLLGETSEKLRAVLQQKSSQRRP